MRPSTMKGTAAARSTKSLRGVSVRRMFSFSPRTYETLDEIAKPKKLSLAWVVRAAAERHISGKWLLFGKRA